MWFKNILFLVLILGVVTSLDVYADGLSDRTKLGLFLRAEFEKSSSQDWAAYEQRFLDHLNWLSSKREQFKSDETFLKLVFSRTHRKFLLNYKKYASFNEIFKGKGYYDCVTGTALYALILDELGYDIEIRESEYHAYLRVHTATKSYLFEATDPIDGFVSDASEIAEREDWIMDDAIAYSSKLAMSAIGENSTESKDMKVNVVNESISLTQLAGLQFYNQALFAFNNEDYHQAYKHIIVAQGIYPSGRIKVAASLMFAIAFSD